MDRVRNGLAEQMTTTKSQATFSIGVVTFDSPPTSVDELLRKADKAMYGVKSAGKNGMVFVKA